jgi:outer membrane immunogenic protein
VGHQVKRILTSIFIAAALSAPALAADMAPAYKAPPLLPAYNWNGWYVGLNAGGTFGNAHDPTTVGDVGNYFGSSSRTSINATNQSTNTRGFTGGVQGGYNWQRGNFLVGFETDFNYFGNRGSDTVSNIYPCCAPDTYTIASSFKTNWLFTARPRLGWAANDWLFYVTGGLAVTQLKADFTFTDTFATAHESASISKTKAGWTAGAGIEHAIWNDWSVKAEYLYADFGGVSTTSANLITFSGARTELFAHKADLRTNVIRLGLNKKF